MLKNDFFTFTALQVDGGTVTTNIQLNAAHPIFKGHFPGQPIVPGVCMIQMVKEVTEDYIGKKIRLVKANDLKFLSFINPSQNESIAMKLNINIEGELVRVDARLVSDATVFFKLKGVFGMK